MKDVDGSLAEGTASFVKKTGRDKLWQRLDKHYKRFIDPKTSLLFEDMAEYRNCIVCREDNTQTIFIKDGFTHVRCLNCGFVYVNPILKEDCFDEVYESSDFGNKWVEVLLSEDQRKFDQAKFEKGVEKINKFTKKGRILDIGCSVGHFLEIARDDGWETVGMELNKRAVEHARSLGLKVWEEKLTPNLFPKEHFEAITLWEVLEHVSEPRELLKEIHLILKDKGILLVLVPNIDSIALRIMHEKSATFGGSSHVNFFNYKTLSRLLKEEGFETVDYETIVSELGTLNNYLNYEHPYLGKGGQILDFLTPEYIHKNLLGYKLLMTVRKVKVKS
ncbi:MAG: hypothetical protein COS84_05130 [Armatimonadetes bacterium CG07_land_8_20_14_0_80_40_9]|nr:MAG: hypothetical protein COS84_05130 [Armatimonadetes bacterium CG07_land_8_20_14_0_80_40_9]